jgi:lipid II:glycine glycyltransferase (peptidoglycan interpeptide bridge formation enzyme)
MVLTRRLGPLAVMYAPRGPMLDARSPENLDAVLDGLERLARGQRAIQIKIDPDIVAGVGVPGEPESHYDPAGVRAMDILKRRGWRFSDEQVQFRNTILIDLTQDEEALLAAMGQGKRRKVRYGPKHGVTVRVATIDDLPVMHTLYAETGRRNGFLTRPYAYYIEEWGALMRAGLAHGLIAEVEGKPVAHVVLFHFARKCLYFTGASTSDNEVRRLMPADLLQWEAMRWAKAQGYAVYDLWGAPNSFTPDDKMWGVYQFKRDFGGQVVRHIGAWDYAPYPALYTLYTRVMPRLLNLMRRQARSGQGDAAVEA